MSELTPCNFCSLKRIKDSAKNLRLAVTILEDPNHGGLRVYRHPKDIKISQLCSQVREQYFAAWFMELPKSCCC